jgi:hypothetical protein
MVLTSLDFVTIISLPISKIGLEDQVPLDLVAQLYHQVQGWLFITFYDSQGYDRCALVHIHTGIYLLLMTQYVPTFWLVHTFVSSLIISLLYFVTANQYWD